MNKMLMSLAAAVAIALTSPAFAQKAPEAAKPAEKSKVAIPAKTFYKGLGPTQYLAKAKLIGQNVFTKDGQKIGDIEDIILGKDNTIDGVIIGAGGFLNVGDKKIGVRYAALKFDTKDGKTTISLPAATKEIVAALEPYEGSRSMLQKAGDKAKEVGKKAAEAAKAGAEKASEAAKTGVEKAKELVKGKETAPAAPAAEQKK